MKVDSSRCRQRGSSSKPFGIRFTHCLHPDLLATLLRNPAFLVHLARRLPGPFPSRTLSPAFSSSPPVLFTVWSGAVFTARNLLQPRFTARFPPATMGATALPDFKPEDDISLEARQRDGNGDGDGDGDIHDKGGTSADAADMSRMGKKQELRRNFKFVGIVGFVTILQATWENVLLSNWFGLYNGGTAGETEPQAAIDIDIACLRLR